MRKSQRKDKKKQQLLSKQEMPKQVQMSYFIIYTVVTTVKLDASSMEDRGYKWCVHRQIVCNDNIFVFNVNRVDAFRWAVRLFKRQF